MCRCHPRQRIPIRILYKSDGAKVGTYTPPSAPRLRYLMALSFVTTALTSFFKARGTKSR